MIITTVSMPDGDDEDFLTLPEVAAIVRVPINTLRWWRQRGTGPAFFKIGRHLVTTIGDLRAWIEEQKRGRARPTRPPLRDNRRSGIPGREVAMASIEKRQRRRQACLAGALPHPGRRPAQQDLRPQGRRRAVPRLGGVLEVRRLFVDPALAQITVGEWAETWLAGQAHLKPSTLDRYAGHPAPPRRARVGHGPAAPSHPRRRAGLGDHPVPHPLARHGPQGAPGAVADARPRRPGRPAARNVAEKINLPRPVRHEQRYLTIAQVEALADECGYPSKNSKHRPVVEREYEPYRLAVLFLAYTGVRFGEMAALRVGRLDLDRRRAVIASRSPWSGPRPGLGHPEDPPAPRGADPAVPGRRAGRPRRGQGSRGPGVHRRPQRRTDPSGDLPPRPLRRRRQGDRGSPACTRTSCGTPPPAWPSPTAPTSRSSSRCSATPPRR